MVAIPRAPRLGRFEFTTLLAMVMAAPALGIDLMLPAFPDMREAFGLAEDSTALAGIVTVYFVGMAVSQAVWGPVADRFGRKPTLYAGLAVYAFAALASALAPSLTFLYVARFFWGVGSAGPRIVALSVVRDRYEGEAMARAMSFIVAIFLLVPVVAPMLGAGILAVSSWRWEFGFCVVYAIAVGLWSRRLEETLKPEFRMELEFRRVARAARFVVSNRQPLGYTLALTVLFGVITSYLTGSEIIFVQVYGRAALFPFIFGGIAGLLGLTTLMNGFVVTRIGLRRLVHGALVGFVVMAVTIFSVAVAWNGVPPFGVFLALLASQMVLFALLFTNMNTLAMDPMGSVAGMAAAVIGMVSIAGGSLLGSLIDRAFDGTVQPFAFGWVACGLAASAFVLWAERVRLPKPLVEA